MASLTRWTWVWVNSGSWWWTGRPGMLRFMGLQRVGHDWETDLNWTELNIFFKIDQYYKIVANSTLKTMTYKKMKLVFSKALISFLPWFYVMSPSSWTPSLPPSFPLQSFSLSQSTDCGFPVSYTKLPLGVYFIYDNEYISMLIWGWLLYNVLLVSAIH